ncbi:maleylpyruvate isomerase family mycothiol-dependent enzyme [Longispora fulva]|uniref:Uncharacterized protein (TIGR03083 family) n=1 Tax=Longispora fulva TaxID=619741 RepID=A0A8J7GRZ4_9ACTN|nr:maleylpyruvate isomerase family mycothiol-dependent enzyme [Longispora fulva]MBG6135916.1 uncharacterized protein (TIGR03083 family) [Longispora fulva]
MTELTPSERILLAEHRTLLPLVRDLPRAALDAPTVCSAWSVLDILAHCGAALSCIARGVAYDSSPAGNETQVLERRTWTVPAILDELEHGLLEAGAAIVASDGAWDGAALGTWIHGGDIRAALGDAGAYASEGLHDAVTLLGASARVRDTPLAHVTLPDRTLELGSPVPGRAPATLRTDAPTLILLYSGRPADPGSYTLTGAEAAELVSQQW